MQFQELVWEIGEDNYSDFIQNDLVAIQFFSDWQMSCLMSLPIIESLAEEFCEDICFGKVNIEEYEEIAVKHGVSNVPTLLILKNGEVIEKIDNSFSEEDLREKICSFCGRTI